MSQSKSKKNNSAWGGIKFLRSSSNEKKIPNGLRALLVSISHSWHSDELGHTQKLSVKEFGVKIQEFYDNACDDYGVKRYNNASLRISKLHSANAHVNFVNLKAHADYVGVPSGVLLLILQMAGDEIIDSDRTLKSFISKIDKAAALFLAIKLMVGEARKGFLVGKNEHDLFGNMTEFKLNEYNLHRLIYSFNDQPEHVVKKAKSE